MNLNEVLKQTDHIYAHKPVTAEQEKEKETLEAHSTLCFSYMEKIVEDKQLEKIFQSLWKCYFNSEEDEKKRNDFALKLFQYAVLFHDTGKINPEYQKNKMSNKYESRRSFGFVSGSDHSLLSAVIYLDFCLGLLEQSGFDKDMQKMFKGLIYVNGYVISRHHSDLADMERFADMFAEDGAVDIMVKGLMKLEDSHYRGLVFLSEENVGNCLKFYEKAMKKSDRKQQMCMFIYARLMYSLLVASDYYATSEYMSGIQIKSFGDLSQIDQLRNAYEKGALVKNIRRYEVNQYGQAMDFQQAKNINVLRSELFLDAEATWRNNKNGHIFFLEAPTGSGKSNVAMNLSFQMLHGDRRKIFYIYPFNTLVEQNLNTIRQLFGKENHIMAQIAVINSITPIKTDQHGDETIENFQASLLDRQFLNYPFVLSTHVSLFQTMFGEQREDVFGFLQLANSVIVLDEIQSYKNTIWSEIILFFKTFAELLNIKVIIMSATLPDLSYLTEEASDIIRLIPNRIKYFQNPLFQNRVNVSYELLDQQINEDILYNHMEQAIRNKKKILIEFISKKSAHQFYDFIQERNQGNIKSFLLTGDDNLAERERVLNQVGTLSETAIVLVGTQVIEAGIDIDMDVGYKDISRLDSDEQFLGRINRSCLRSGMAYFFHLNAASKIYKNDLRISPEFTLTSQPMRSILQEKTFGQYYQPILDRLKAEWNDSSNEDGLEYFFSEEVKPLRFLQVEKRMKLIDDDMQTISVFLSRTVTLSDGRDLAGEECWNRYKKLLCDQDMDYAEKQIRLSQVRSHMTYFIYEINRSTDFLWTDKIGELYYIADGQQYFHEGKLNMEKFKV